MWLRNVTWGQLRRHHEYNEANGITTADDYLADPELLEESYLYEDDEYFFDISDEEAEFYKKSFKNVNEDYYVAHTDDESETPTALVRMDSEDDDVMDYMTVGGWKSVGEEEVPEVDDAVMAPVYKGVVKVWEKIAEEGRIPTRKELDEFF